MTTGPLRQPPTMDRHERRRGMTDALESLAAVDLDALRARADPRRLPRWLVAVLLVAVPSHALAVWRVFGDLPVGSRPPLRDSLIFEYIGWYLTRGARLYVDIWEVKPPLPFEVTAALSLLAGGDPVLAHWLNVLVTTGSAVGAAVVVGAVVADLTGDEVAAFAAAVSLYVLPAYHWRVAFGFKVKYLVALLVLLAVLLARRDRPGVAGIAAGAAVGCWQFAVVAPVLALGIAADRGGRDAAVRVAAGAVGVLILVVLPVLYWGALEAMVTETVLVPLLVGREQTLVEQVRLAKGLFGPTLLVVFVGAVGVLVGARWRPRETWWLAVGTAWFGLQVLVVDLDGPPDLFVLLAFLGVGLGVLLGLEGGHQRPAALLVAGMAVLSVVTMGGFGLGGSTLYEPDPVVYDPDLEIEVPYSPLERSHLYWSRVPAETCRAFYGTTQDELVRLTGQSSVARTCGHAGPVVDALLSRWLGG